MHKLFFIVLTLFSFHSFAFDSDNSDKLIRILVNHGITPSVVLEATVYCNDPDSGQLKDQNCTVFAGPPGFELNSSFEELAGKKANKLSRLLKVFNVEPKGKKSLQSAHIKCLLPGENLDSEPSCVVLQQYEMSDY